MLTAVILDAGRARKALSDAEHSLKLTEDQVKEARTGLDNLFNPEWFGREGEWKKLKDVCLSKDTGEYVTARSCATDLTPLSDTRTKSACLALRSRRVTMGEAINWGDSSCSMVLAN